MGNQTKLKSTLIASMCLLVLY